ncbi:glycosyltransferase family 87 protein [Chloroflexus sp.]|uniref:glycosyltransferase family 87 protein n=1 Tax=Chloroflexus sp. TaxID=1904827 RepID=UPI002ACEE796|nr:glycosyltransferase family 87 protein [Chloroflexus sp.]
MNILKNNILYSLFFVYAIITFSVDAYTFVRSAFFGVDFHSYWYAGHFVRQGTDPYFAAIHGISLQLPITYIDGNLVSHEPVAQPDLMRVPANTAPIVLLLTIFAFFSWHHAVWIWFLLNTLFAILNAIVIVKLFTNKPSIIHYLLSILLFLSLFSTKSALHTGQTTLIVSLLMFLAVLFAERNVFVAGIALGIALSKYSLSLPVILFLWFKRKYSLISIAALVQILSAFVLAWLTNTSPFVIIIEYLTMIAAHISQSGIHLASYFVKNNIIVIILTIGITIPMLLVVHYWTQIRSFNLLEEQRQLLDMNVLALFNLHTLLSFYHREYDAVIWIISFFVLFFGLKINVWNVSQYGKIIISVLMFLSVLWMARAEILLSLLRMPSGIENILTTTVLFVNFMVIFFFFYRTKTKITSL